MQSMPELTVLTPELQAAVWACCADGERVPIVPWAESVIDMSHDVTAHRDGPLTLYPYQVEPLAQSENPETTEIDLMFGQRLGKSQLWKISGLKRIHDGRLSGMVLYPSEKEALETNRDTVLPLLKTLRRVKIDLQSRGNIKKDGYHLPSCQSILYYSGASPAISKTLNWGAIDEADFCMVAKSSEEGHNTSNVTALKLRMKTYREHLMWVVSSPTLISGIIYQRWRQGSRGVWHLRCLGCDALTAGNQLAFPQQDGTYRGLQWEKTEQGDVITDSIRWVCPRCGMAHEYSQAPEMTRHGEYIHAAPEKLDHRSYQAGALANPWLWTWREIADAQENSGTVEGRKFLQNTIKGMPFKASAKSNSSEDLLQVLASKKTEYEPGYEREVSVVILGADQQMAGLGGAKYYVWTARGWAENGDSWLLGCGICNSLRELREIGSAKYAGMRPLIRILDQGGFDNLQDTDPFIKTTPGWLYYKGEDDRTLKGQMWKFSNDDPSTRLVLANAIEYQVKLLDAIYGPPRPTGYRWHLPENVSSDYFGQVGAVQPNPRKIVDSEAFGHWQAGKGQRRDYFDAEKMAYVGLDVASQNIPAPYWPRKNLPLFLRLELLAELRRQQAASKK